MNYRASGTFDVKLTPVNVGGEPIGRMQIDKRFRGGLEAKSLGQMLSVTTSVQGSAAYVAMERVEGALDGREGSFVLHHTGVMDRGKAALSVLVVPDSGTGSLAGLTGSMTIRIESGNHLYEFEYALPK